MIILIKLFFYHFKLRDIGKYAITDRLLLSVLVSGFPEKEIVDITEYGIFRITEGKISRFTQQDNSEIDRGLFLEEIFFTLKASKNSPLDLTQFNLDNNIEYWNKDFLEKKINLITALTLLNPEIYSKDLTHFR